MNENINLENFIKDGMVYNTGRRGIVLTQYGRNIQKLVTYALKIEEKQERNKAAAQIIQAMEILNPKIKYIDDYKRILWNHLAIMSGHKLDIDYPFEIITEEEISISPEKIPIIKKRIKKKLYGRIIANMVNEAIEIEDKELQQEYVKEILIQMKRIYVNWNKDVVSDIVIFDDFKNISNAQIPIPENFKLPQSYEIRNRLRTTTTTKRPTNNTNKRYRKKH